MITSTHVRLGKQLESCIEEVWQITAGELPLLSPSSQINYHISCWHHDSSLFGRTLGQQNVPALAHWHRILDGFYCQCVAAFLQHCQNHFMCSMHFFPTFCKERHLVASSECMKEQKSFGFLWSKAIADCMDKLISSILSTSEFNPQLLEIQLRKQSY